MMGLGFAGLEQRSCRHLWTAPGRNHVLWRALPAGHSARGFSVPEPAFPRGIHVP